MKSRTYIISILKGQWVIALLYAFIFSIICQFNLLYTADNAIKDLLYQHEQALDGSITVIGIDEQSLERLGPLQTWDRSIMAEVIRNLNQSPDMLPAVIGVDMMYYGNTTNESDKQLADAAAQYKNVVTGASVYFKQTVISQADGAWSVNPLGIAGIEMPYEALKAASRQGHLNTVPDEDGVVRKSMHSIELNDNESINSFAYEIYQMYAQKNGLPDTATPPMNKQNQWYIPYSAKSGGYYDGLSVVDILDGNFSPEMLAGSIVLIGPYAAGMQDAYSTPIDHAIPMYGVEIHANIIQALLDGRTLADVWPLLQSVCIFFVLLIANRCFHKLQPRSGAVFFLAVMTLYFTAAYYAGAKGYMVRPLYPLLGLLLLYVGWLAAHYVAELLERRRVTSMFKKYVAPQIVDEIIKKDKNELHLGGAKREIACMFVDIRGFTPMSEALSPEQVVEILNECLALTSNAIFHHGGTLDKFIGDATMALFNAPLDQQDYCYQAVLSAWDIVNGCKAMEPELTKRFGRSIQVGIGLHKGFAVVGNIGTESRMDYTAIGDTVNTASRLEHNAAAGQVLLSQAFYEEVKEKIEACPLGEISLKGKSQTVYAYGLSHIKEEYL